MRYEKIDLGITKLYLLAIKDGYMLIDTGYKNDYKKFLKLMQNKNICISKIKYLFITHYHDDHAGFATTLKQNFKIPLIVQQASIKLLAKGDSEGQESEQPITKRVEFIFKLFSLFHKNFKYPPVIIDDKDIVIKENDSKFLRGLGLEADIVYTPGHTCDSMSILCDDGTAFVGDSCMNFLNLLGADYRPIYYTNKEMMYKSIAKLIKLGAKKIAPAHGKEFGVNKLKKMLKSRGKL